jgi:hypothetical protein
MSVDPLDAPAGVAVVQALASVTPGTPRSFSPVVRLTNTNGMVPVADMVTRPRQSSRTALNTTPAS